MSNARNLSKFKPSSSGLVETADIADDAITNAKVADDAVNTAQIADDAVTTAKVNPSQTDITSVGALDAGSITSGFGAIDVGSNSITTTGGASFGNINATTVANINFNSHGTYLGNYRSIGWGGTANGTTQIYSQYNTVDDLVLHAGTGKGIIFETGGSTADRMTLDSNGDLTIGSGDLKIGTSGKGIDFSATGDGFVTAGTEVFTDYERGAYTLSFNGFANQTVSQGYYVKVGHLCYVTTFIHASGSQNTNSFTCNLPFTPESHSASNNSGYYVGSIGPTMHYRVDTGTAGMVSYVTAGTATFRLYEVNADGDWQWMQNNAFTSEDQAWIAFSYVTAT